MFLHAQLACACVYVAGKVRFQVKSAFASVSNVVMRIYQSYS